MDNAATLALEAQTRQYLAENPTLYSHLYPNLNDPNFNIKIAQKPEFSDTKYDGTIRNIHEYSEILAKADYEILPHQQFVRNFLSFQTPYNSLLLYHGLGSGKTCSAIGVCEEMRDYMRQLGTGASQIYIVASPNVQDNFRLQLFDERTLVEIDGIWTSRGCIGNKLLKEINPTNTKNISKKKVISMINQLISSSYSFKGYVQFANTITKIVKEAASPKMAARQLQQMFGGALLVIDEFHNIRLSGENENKNVAKCLSYLVKVVEGMRLLLLSGTPMFNNYKEIVWLTNVLNMNDRRGLISVKQIFDAEGNFRNDQNATKMSGRELLAAKLTGYVSYVRGENVYTFPFRVYPNMFAREHTFKSTGGTLDYPTRQVNGIEIPPESALTKLCVYTTQIGEIQKQGYNEIIENLRARKQRRRGATSARTSESATPLTATPATDVENLPADYTYTDLQIPIEALNIVYPLRDFEEELETGGATIGGAFTPSATPAASTPTSLRLIDAKSYTGTSGLKRVMNYIDTEGSKDIPPEKSNFEYRAGFERIFAPSNVHKYSGKITTICDFVRKSEGIIVVYSAYLDAGLVPMALALEEMGFNKHGGKNLFKESPPSGGLKGTYEIICGDKRLSPNNDAAVKAATASNNINGKVLKVILISQTGSEGLDFKCVRQVFIMEPWYNVNRIEQIFGRGVRNLSHRTLPFEQRNVQLFMLGTENGAEEPVDLYVYRMAEAKAVKIGPVTRLLKQISVDCIINHDQVNFVAENFADQDISQTLADGTHIAHFPVGDMPNTAQCDYMETCMYQCLPSATAEMDESSSELQATRSAQALAHSSGVARTEAHSSFTSAPENATYHESFLLVNADKIVNKIRALFKDKHFYTKQSLIGFLNTPKPYPIAQIYAALSLLIEDATQFITDKYGRNGRLVNVGDYYLFQPIELENAEDLTILERSMPIDFKHGNLKVAWTQHKEEVPETGENALFAEIYDNYIKGMMPSTFEIKQGERDWYKYWGIVMASMKTDNITGVTVSGNELERFLVEHLVDTLMADEKLSLLTFLDIAGSHKEPPVTPLSERLKVMMANYIRRTKVVHGVTPETEKAIVVFDGPSAQKNMQLRVYRLTTDLWTEAEPQDKSELAPVIQQKYDAAINLSRFVGFIGFETNNKYMVFKVKDFNVKRGKGFRIDQYGKGDVIKIINTIFGEEKFTAENTKENMYAFTVRTEILFRYWDSIQKDGKRWFVSTEEAVMYKFG